MKRTLVILAALVLVLALLVGCTASDGGAVTEPTHSAGTNGGISTTDGPIFEPAITSTHESEATPSTTDASAEDAPARSRSSRRNRLVGSGSIPRN